MKKTENFKVSNEVVNVIKAEIFSFYKIDEDLNNNLGSNILPHISNALYHKELEVLENERFKTLITLSRTLDDENLYKVINALDYKLTINK